MHLRIILLTLALPAALRSQVPATSDSGRPAPPVVAADADKLLSSRVPLGEFQRALAFVRNGQEQRVGTIVERISVDGSGAAARLVRAQEITMGQRRIVDTAVSHRGTLAPIWHSSKQPTAAMALRFDGRHVTGTHTTGTAAPEPIDQTVSVVTFDSNNQELVMGALPLALGYSARLPMYVYEMKGIAWCDVHVSTEEVVDGTESWKVDATYAGARGSYWFAKRTGVMLKSEMTTPTGAVMRMTLVK